MLKQFYNAVFIAVIMTVLTGILYPLSMISVAQLLFPYQANGSLITQNGRVIGSQLIGQAFTGEAYFHGRPSAAVLTSPSLGYDPTASGGSNLSPTNAALIARITADAERLQDENPLMLIPVDLVTASGSGLDPDITPAAAEFQVQRVARARNLPQWQVRRLVTEMTEGRTGGILGEPRVNVLEINLGLDEMAVHTRLQQTPVGR
jgi:K+-transporting ATPase ATPase C chain